MIILSNICHHTELENICFSWDKDFENLLSLQFLTVQFSIIDCSDQTGYYIPVTNL